MKTVDTIARSRREFVRGRPIKKIARGLHVSRNTVREILRSGEAASSYERETQPQPRIGLFCLTARLAITMSPLRCA